MYCTVFSKTFPSLSQLHANKAIKVEQLTTISYLLAEFLNHLVIVGYLLNTAINIANSYTLLI